MADVYCDPTATGSDDGSSWANAYTSLATAMSALSAGDNLFSDADYANPIRESGVDLDTDNINWYPGMGPSGKTVMTRLVAAPSWSGSTTYSTTEPAEGVLAVVYDLKFDDNAGTVTGVDTDEHRNLLSRHGVSQVVARAPYGFVQYNSGGGTSPGAARWSVSGGNLYVNPTGGAVTSSLITYIPGGAANFIDLSASGVHIHPGLVGWVNPNFSSNNGYTVKGLSGSNNIVEGVTSYYCGWHAVGFANNTENNNEIRNCVTVGMGACLSGGTLTISNPWVHYCAVTTRTGRTGNNLTFLAFPLLGTDGSPVNGPVLNGTPDSFTTPSTQRSYNPRSLYSHTDAIATLSDVVWRDCLQIDFTLGIESKHSISITNGGTFCGAANTGGLTGDVTSSSSYPVKVFDCIAIGPSAWCPAGNDMHTKGCVFDRTGAPSGQEDYKTAYVEDTTIYTGDFDSLYYNRVDTDSSVCLDGVTVQIQTDAAFASGGGASFIEMGNGDSAVNVPLISGCAIIDESASGCNIFRASSNTNMLNFDDFIVSDGTNQFDSSITEVVRANNPGPQSERTQAQWNAVYAGDVFVADPVAPQAVPPAYSDESAVSSAGGSTGGSSTDGRIDTGSKPGLGGAW